MIKLTNYENGKAVYIQPDYIKCIYSGLHATNVNIAEDEVYVVTESPEQVTRKILEYKLAMVRYVALSHAWATNQALEKHGESTLQELFAFSGLEEGHD